MDQLLSTNWGDIVGAVGLVITVIGFGVAIYQATKAREAADAAEAASLETRQAITKVLTVADLQKAIAAIQRIKDLHRDKEWKASLQHYQPLRVMLVDITARYVALTPGQHAVLSGAIPQIVVIENSVDEALRGSAEPSGAGNFNEALTTIQVNLEGIASSLFPGGEAGR